MFNKRILILAIFSLVFTAQSSYAVLECPNEDEPIADSNQDLSAIPADSEGGTIGDPPIEFHNAEGDPQTPSSQQITEAMADISAQLEDPDCVGFCRTLMESQASYLLTLSQAASGK